MVNIAKISSNIHSRLGHSPHFLSSVICKLVGPTLAVSLEPFSQSQNLAISSLFYTLEDPYQKWESCVPHYSCKRSTRYCVGLFDISIACLSQKFYCSYR